MVSTDNFLAFLTAILIKNSEIGVKLNGDRN